MYSLGNFVFDKGGGFDRIDANLQKEVYLTFLKIGSMLVLFIEIQMGLIHLLDR